MTYISCYQLIRYCAQESMERIVAPLFRSFIRRMDLFTPDHITFSDDKWFGDICVRYGGYMAN